MRKLRLITRRDSRVKEESQLPFSGREIIYGGIHKRGILLSWDGLSTFTLLVIGQEVHSGRKTKMYGESGEGEFLRIFFQGHVSQFSKKKIEITVWTFTVKEETKLKNFFANSLELSRSWTAEVNKGLLVVSDYGEP